MTAGALTTTGALRAVVIWCAPVTVVFPFSYSCAKTLDQGKCKKADLRFTFQGRVGLITSIDDAAEIPKVTVSFNEGRTSYEFDQSDVKLETTPRSMYGKSALTAVCSLFGWLTFSWQYRDLVGCAVPVRVHGAEAEGLQCDGAAVHVRHHAQQVWSLLLVLVCCTTQ
jgi:hypothetical protein